MIIIFLVYESSATQFTRTAVPPSDQLSMRGPFRRRPDEKELHVWRQEVAILGVNASNQIE
jgi:hypothetical protein